MTYQICYDTEPSSTAMGGCETATRRMEEYRTEGEALGRVRELIEAGEHDSLSVRDSTGNVLCGVRLQLKLESVA